ncbi:DMT family transporter [Corynebacterium hansenii]|uniref:DMT family transporter n=1 Tax=Corynebacterium hansenii TaxID=394964 RepID=A0ABV7ZPW3_9CORY|nr:multidrug efflux SMR transporter [Corynebacterium hansenii]WJZ01147.1 Quaternary ammonium compound-resistance protein SugE [Corynebacterium hansenii]
MAWFILIASGAFEAVWAIALGKSDGFTRLWPSVIFFSALAVSMGGLAWAMRELPLGTAYAVWVGVGATLTVVWGMVFDGDPVTLPRMLFLAMIVGGIVGLKALA